MRPAVLSQHERSLPPVTSPRPGASEIAGKFLSITSYRRNGVGVATPVWFVTEGRRFLVMTDARSGKVKRIRRDPFVRIAGCTARGRPKTEPIPAYAELLPPSEAERVKRLFARRYRVDLLFVRPVRALQALFRPEKRHEETVILAIAPVPLSHSDDE
ncbi:MAG TPA: PPOX class F420-dependent oxidoreductase [Actinomycetota bacterium]|nr:PPOX class F420-dependent oxidoreductase [Actinomycetota bacterium]